MKCEKKEGNSRKTYKIGHRSGQTAEIKKAPMIGAFEIHGAQGRNRTVDTRIFSPLLYRLSYLGGSYKRAPLDLITGR